MKNNYNIIDIFLLINHHHLHVSFRYACETSNIITGSAEISRYMTGNIDSRNCGYSKYSGNRSNRNHSIIT